MIHGKEIGRPFGIIYMCQDEWDEGADGRPTGKRVYRTRYNGWMENAPKIGSLHPLATNYELHRRTCVQLVTNGLLCDVTLLYRKKKSAGEPTTYAQIAEDIYDVNDASIDIPIEQHPDFSTQIGGTPDAPLNGAIFDPDTGQFKGFGRIDSHTVSEFYGVTKFQLMSHQVSVTKFYLAEQSPPSGSVLRDPGRRYVSSGGLKQYRITSSHEGKQGIYFTQTIVYLFSPLGWNTVIYT